MSDLAATSKRLADLGVTRATLLLDEARARANIRHFAQRANAAGVVMRPHFKTHQSAAVAGWFRDEGVTRATVSSLGQAAYFADHGWDDLTVAIGLNPRELNQVADLAGRISLGVAVDHGAQVAALARCPHPVRVWIELDVGYGRAGIPHQDTERIAALLDDLAAHGQLTATGLLTHAGHSYGTDPGAAAEIFHQTRQRLQTLRRQLDRPDLLLSAGDTPGFAAVDDWSGLDEARPGNFVFHDLMQLAAGACGADQLACAVACPIIGVYPRRRQVVVHAGAVHLSKDGVATPEGLVHGRLLTLAGSSFGRIADDGLLTGLSQEHGTVTFATAAAMAGLEPGDLLLVVPAHSCLACEQFADYRTANGDVLTRYRRG